VTRRAERSGYALLVVLWLGIGVSGLAMAITATARATIAATANRRALTAASWQAAGCLAWAHAMLAAATDESRGSEATRAAWRQADSVIRSVSPPSALRCTVAMRALGGQLDVNGAAESTLARLLRHAGLPGARADSATAAIADWRDADDEPRPGGAERSWYDAAGRLTPANAPFASRRELRLVRGLEDLSTLDSILDVETAPVALNRAAAPVLALLPGFSPDVVARVLENRRAGEPVTSFLPPARLSSAALEIWNRQSSSLPATATIDPLAWLLTVRARSGSPAVTVVVEERLQTGSAERVVRHREWIE
jgi:general secretion pathway protein K